MHNRVSFQLQRQSKEKSTFDTLHKDSSHAFGMTIFSVYPTLFTGMTVRNDFKIGILNADDFVIYHPAH